MNSWGGNMSYFSNRGMKYKAILAKKPPDEIHEMDLATYYYGFGQKLFVLFDSDHKEYLRSTCLHAVDLKIKKRTW